MNRFSSIFSQLLQLFPRTEFQKAVQERVICLTQNHEYEELKKKNPGIILNVVTPRKVGSKDIVLASNQ